MDVDALLDAVELGHAPETPPALLFHGTTERALPAVLAEGLVPGRRHAVHLSGDPRRRAQSALATVVLRVDAAAMSREGAVFTRSTNGVGLVWSRSRPGTSPSMTDDEAFVAACTMAHGSGPDG